MYCEKRSTNSKFELNVNKRYRSQFNRSNFYLTLKKQYLTNSKNMWGRTRTCRETI